jgi:hypothetical protein
MRRQLVFLTALGALCVPCEMVSAALLLAVDVNDRTVVDAPNSVAGFSAYTMTGTTAASSVVETQVIGAYTVSLIAADDGLDENNVTAGLQNTTGQIDDRDRATPVDAGAFTYAQIYDDVIFAGASTGPTGGMNLTVSGGALLPNTTYVVSLYAFDSGSTAAPVPRTANWLDGNNADALVVATSFNGAILPIANDQYLFTGVAQTDGSGVLLLKGRSTTPYTATGPAQIGVFLNGFEINETPEPASIGIAMAALGLISLVRRR